MSNDMSGMKVLRYKLDREMKMNSAIKQDSLQSNNQDQQCQQNTRPASQDNNSRFQRYQQKFQLSQKDWQFQNELISSLISKSQNSTLIKLQDQFRGKQEMNELIDIIHQNQSINPQQYWKQNLRKQEKVWRTDKDHVQKDYVVHLTQEYEDYKNKNRSKKGQQNGLYQQIFRVPASMSKQKYLEVIQNNKQSRVDVAGNFSENLKSKIYIESDQIQNTEKLIDIIKNSRLQNNTIADEYDKQMLIKLQKNDGWVKCLRPDTEGEQMQLQGVNVFQKEKQWLLNDGLTENHVYLKHKNEQTKDEIILQNYPTSHKHKKTIKKQCSSINTRESQQKQLAPNRSKKQ